MSIGAQPIALTATQACQWRSPRRGDAKRWMRVSIAFGRSFNYFHQLSKFHSTLTLHRILHRRPVIYQLSIEERKIKRLQQNRASALKWRKKKKELFEHLSLEKDELLDQTQRMEQEIFTLSANFTYLFQENKALKERIRELETGLPASSWSKSQSENAYEVSQPTGTYLVPSDVFNSNTMLENC